MKTTNSPLLLAIMILLGIPNFATAEEHMLTLNDALSMALKNNLNLELSKQDATMAGQVVTANEGVFDPLITAIISTGEKHTTPLAPDMADHETTGNWQVTIGKKFITGTEISVGWDNNRYWTDTGFNTVNPAYTSGVSFEINQPLLRGFGSDYQGADIAAAKKEEEAAAFLVDATAADLAANVKTAYWQLVSAWQDIEVQKLSLSLAQKLEEETREKIKNGVLAEVDIFQPQSIVALREQQLISVERTIGLAEDQLKLILNDANWETTITPQDRPKIIKINIEGATILANALNNRPDINAAKSIISANKLKTAKRKDDIRPSLALQGQVIMNGTDDQYSNAIRMDNGTDNQWQVGLVFSTTFGNKTRKSQYHMAKTSLAKAKTNYLVLKQQIHSLTRSAIRDVHLSLKAVEATEKTTVASLNNLKAEQAKFDIGRATTFDVLTAQESYAQAVATEYHAQISYVIALAEIDRIQGKITK